MLLLIDNFDSFTYNIVQYFQTLGKEVTVIRNNVLSPLECLNLNPQHIVIGPGPGTPSSAGISKELILTVAGKIPLMGICLGMQAIAEVFGGEVIRGLKPFHGKTSPIFHCQQGIFENIPNKFSATRYHSLIVKESSLPSSIQVTAKTEDGIIMGLKHIHWKIEGVQFHPESVQTQFGYDLLKNFLKN